MPDLKTLREGCNKDIADEVLEKNPDDPVKSSDQKSNLQVIGSPLDNSTLLLASPGKQPVSKAAANDDDNQGG